MSIVKSFANIASQIGTGLVKSTNEAWGWSNVRTSELARGRFTPKDGQAYIPHLRGFVEVFATLNATTCAGATLVQMKRGAGKKISKQRHRSLVSKAMGDSNGDLTEVDNSAFLDLLENPSEFESGQDQKFTRFYGKEACGNSFFYLSDSGDMMTLRPQFIAPIIQDQLPSVSGWVYGRGREREIAIPYENVWQFKHKPSIDTPWLGVGPLAACVEYADLLIFGTVAEAARWRNGNPPPYAVILPETITDPVKRDSAVKEIERQIGGPENAGNRIVLQAADIKNLGFPPKDMEYVQGSKVSAHMVALAYGIPESLVWPNDSSLATAVTAEKLYHRFAILPRLNRDAAQLTELGRFLGLLGPNDFMAYENPSEVDNQAEATYWDLRIRNGSATVDEAREDMGMEPLPDSLGTLPRQDGTLLSNEPPEPKVLPAGNADKGKPPAPGDKALSLANPILKERGGLDIATERDATDLERQKQSEERTRQALVVWFLLCLADVEQESVVISGSPDAQGNVPHSTIGAHFALSPERVSQLGKILAEGHAEAVRQSIASDVASTGFSSISPAKPLASIAQHSVESVESITQTTQNDIIEAIRQGIANGKTVGQIAEDLKAAGYPEERADLIAQTEIAYASEIAAKEFANIHGLKWKTLYLGPSPCPECVQIKEEEDLRGGATPTNDSYTLSGHAVEGPLFHPRCYCTCVFHNRAPSGGLSE